MGLIFLTLPGVLDTIHYFILLETLLAFGFLAPHSQRSSHRTDCYFSVTLIAPLFPSPLFPLPSFPLLPHNLMLPECSVFPMWPESYAPLLSLLRGLFPMVTIRPTTPPWASVHCCCYLSQKHIKQEAGKHIAIPKCPF